VKGGEQISPKTIEDRILHPGRKKKEGSISSTGFRKGKEDSYTTLRHDTIWAGSPPVKHWGKRWNNGQSRLENHPIAGKRSKSCRRGRSRVKDNREEEKHHYLSRGGESIAGLKCENSRREQLANSLFKKGEEKLHHTGGRGNSTLKNLYPERGKTSKSLLRRKGFRNFKDPGLIELSIVINRVEVLTGIPIKPDQVSERDCNRTPRPGGRMKSQFSFKLRVS